MFTEPAKKGTPELTLLEPLSWEAALGEAAAPNPGCLWPGASERRGPLSESHPRTQLQTSALDKPS